MRLFRERHRAPSSVVILGIIVAAGSAAGLVASIPSLCARSGVDASAVIAAPSVGIALGLSAATQTLSIVVRDGLLVVRLTPFFRKSVPVARIESISRRPSTRLGTPASESVVRQADRLPCSSAEARRRNS